MFGQTVRRSMYPLKVWCKDTVLFFPRNLYSKNSETFWDGLLLPPVARHPLPAEGSSASMASSHCRGTACGSFVLHSIASAVLASEAHQQGSSWRAQIPPRSVCVGSGGAKQRPPATWAYAVLMAWNFSKRWVWEHDALPSSCPGENPTSAFKERLCHLCEKCGARLESARMSDCHTSQEVQKLTVSMGSFWIMRAQFWSWS